MKALLVYLANVATGEHFLGLPNDFTLQQEDWLQLTPIGEFPHEAGVQRVDKAAVDEMVANFNSLRSRFSRRFGGLPFYIGHPDVPAFANKFPDRKAYGWVMDLEARADGLHGKVKWSEAGKELVANAHYKFFSPYWGAKEIGMENIGGRRTKVFRPIELVSVGLTNEPNIPVLPLSNEQTAPTTMKLPDWLIQLLGLSADVTEEQAKTALSNCVNERNTLTTAKQTLANEKATADGALTAEKTAHSTTRTTLEGERDAAQTKFANERKARTTLLLDLAIQDGRITPAQRPQWQADLDKEFDTKSVALANQAPQMNTRPQTGALGDRKQEADQGLTTAQNQLLALANEKARNNPALGFDRAWNEACAEKPELFKLLNEKKTA